MSDRKEIWLPKSTMNVQVTNEGQVTVWEDMTMERKQIQRTGFSQPTEGTRKKIGP